MFFEQHWQFKPVTNVVAHPVRQLLVVGEQAVVDKVCARDRELASITSRACWGEQFATEATGQFIVNPEHTADWIALFEKISPVPEAILFFAEGCSWSPQQLLSRLCALTQALIKTKSETVRVLFCYGNDAGNATFSALDAFFKSIASEKPAYKFQAIEIDSAATEPSLPVVLATELAQESAHHHVRYIDGKRHVPRLSLVDMAVVDMAVVDKQNADQEWRAPAGFKEQGTYLITGGMGALGFLFAAHIAETYTATVILCGRSALDDGKAARLKSLGPRVSYVQADLADKTRCEGVFNALKRDGVKLDGVIHSAGSLHDKLITGINARDIEQVLDAKVNATENIIRNLNADSLDFLVLFSSWAGVTGNEGQSIYAYGNAYLNYRASELAEQLPNINKVIAMAWPLWHGEGMGNQQEIQEKLLATTGMVPMQAAQGIAALNTALNHDAAMLACFSGAPQNLDTEHIVFSFNRELPATKFDTQPLTAQVIRDCENFLRNLLAQESGLTPAEIDKERAFEQLGLDSIMIGRLNRQLSTSFHDLPKTLFFECQNLAELTEWFVAKRAQQLSRKFASGEPENLHRREISLLATESKPTHALDASRKKAVDQFQQYLLRNDSVTGRFTPVEKPSLPAVEPIAIIGCSGRYPQADTLDAFWQNLLQGHDAISEIPPERWAHQGYFDPEGRDGKTYAKWGGFINDVEMFDPLFFNLSPKDAEYLDPQDRIFLQSAWHTVEDAGYTRNALKGKNVGVYLGVMWGQYQLYGPVLAERGDYRVPASSYASIANRVSYFMDFTGPSIALDTMCSSSLTALHLACESLRTGECNYALVGGVNLSIHPQKYLYLGQGKFPSSDGRCRSFGDGGDGYVPGEGVGSVLLKPLSAAIAERDNIYGVILGSAVNHGGKTNGYTVPNPKAQTSVIAAAFDKARIDPASISYIECHGTGTALGDPIEIAGLENVFGNSRTVDNPIIIGSVKSNIGHLEAAAGMASLSKVLLQFNARTLVPSLHANPPNSNISFARLPFKVQTRVEEWNSHTAQPRRACISSFGAGGANAHVILEEYVSSGNAAQIPEGLHLFVLSAKTNAALAHYVDCYHEALIDGNLKDASIADICFSAQVAREAFDYRLAIVVEDKQQLLEKLRDYNNSANKNNDKSSSETRGNGNAGIYSGNTKSSQLRELLSTELVIDGQGLGDNIATTLLKDVIAKRNQWHQLAKLWVNGFAIDWSLAYINHANSVSKIHLPVYPFAKEYCWLDLQKIQSPAIHALPFTGGHALAGENISTFYQQKYRFVFDKNNYFINDHRFEKQSMLPGAALVEMAIVAANSAVDELLNEVSDIQWLAPVVVGEEPKSLEMAFNLEADFIHFRLYDATNLLHIFSEGKIAKGEVNPPLSREVSPENFDAVYARCDNGIDASLCYQLLAHYGLEYGDHFKTIQELRLGEQELLARIAFNKIPQDQRLQNLHVCLLDGALQAVIGFIEKETLVALAADPLLPIAITRRLLPKSIAKLTFTAPLPSTFWVHIHQRASDAQSNDLSFDIDIIDMHGDSIARISDFALAPVNKVSEHELAYWVPAWRSSDTSPARDVPAIANCLVIDSDETLRAQLLESGLALKAIAVIPGTDIGNPDAGQLVKTLDLTREDKVAAFVDQVGEPDVVLINTAAILIDQNNYGVAASRALQASYIFARALLSRTEKPLRLIVLSPTTAQHAALAASLRGLYSTAAREFSHFSFKIIEVAIDTFKRGLVDNSLPGIIRNELSLWNPEENYVRFTPEGNRTVRYLKEFQPQETHHKKITVSGHYLITGGAGSLGFAFAQHLAQRGAEKITLVGRRDIDATINARLDELTTLGIEARYIAVDLAESAAVHAMVASLLSEGPITGVIHSAGHINDGLIRNKPVDIFMQVIASKVAGTINLVEALTENPPQFFAAFSSVAALQGNTGQADYAAANAFMDEYLATQSLCPNVISINWPLWEEGMHVDEKSLAYLKNRVGMFPLPTRTGTAIFDQLLNLDVRQPVVLYGNKNLLQEYFSPKKPTATEDKVVVAADQTLTTEQQIKNYLYEKISVLLGLDRARIRGDVSLEDYGVDSAATINLMAILEKDFGKLNKTLLFEFPTINELANYFIREYPHVIISLSVNTISMGNPVRVAQLPTADARVVVQENTRGFLATDGKKLKFQGQDKTRVQDNSIQDNSIRDIAVIGMAGRYPNAANLEEFWENLKAGLDSISEIPADRWDHAKYFDPQSNQDGKIYAKWGGFINDIDAFDALFFKISPREAELMDPQERLFLQTVWHTLEDAGYPASSLAKRKVGIFVGAMWNQYQLLGLNRTVGEAGYLAPNSSVASIANRVSYVFDFCGPSLSLDSMCSSSLSGLHLACESIARGESELAIAGGVNLNLHENKYFQLSQNRFLASDGRCRSFGAGGDGYVPGEGVGAVLLKPLADAVRDGDRIQGVILGSAINHGGKTKGYTVPSPSSQAEVIRAALAAANVRPQDVSYIEAHGTGTALGDPIEIEGLARALRTDAETEARGAIAIGSVKSNIGHLEGAAGVAALSKVLLQFRHGQLVASLHSEPENPNIDFANSLFNVQKTLSGWQERTRKPGVPYGRISGISSFGAGGSNAHVIVADYLHKSPREIHPDSRIPGGKNIFLLSAKDHQGLLRFSENLFRALSRDVAQFDLDDICFTLQTGREHFQHRLAIVCSTIGELLIKLEDFCFTKASEGDIFLSDSESDSSEGSSVSVEQFDADKVARSWVNGAKIDWFSLYHNERPQRISLPGYPFNRDRYWYGQSKDNKSSASHGTWNSLQLITADETSGRLTARISATSDFVVDHRIHGQVMLPGAVYFDLVRSALLHAPALQQVLPAIPNAIGHIAWSLPFSGSEESLVIQLTRSSAYDHTSVGFTLTHANGELCRGQLYHRRDVAAVSHFSLTEYERSIGDGDLYQLFSRNGFIYGPSLQVLKKVYYQESHAIGELSLPPIADTESGWSPAAIDGAFQTCLALHLTSEGSFKHSDIRYIPLSLGEIVFSQPISQRLFVMVTRKEVVADEQTIGANSFMTKFDVKCVNESGARIFTISDFTVIGRSVAAVKKKMRDTKPLLFRTVWEHSN